MLKKIRLTDFKSFVDEEVGIAPLTLLVGANASGKSNFLDAIRFLQGLTLDLTLAEVLNGEERGRPDRWPGIRGRAEEASRVGTTRFAVESSWLVPNLEMPPGEGGQQWIPLRHRIACRVSPATVRESEWIERGNQTLSPPSMLAEQRSILSPQSYLKLSGTELNGFLPLNSLRLALAASRFLSIQPAAMREYGRRGAPLGDGGENLSGVLATLCDDPATRQSLVAWLRAVCAPELEDVDFAEVQELGDVMALFIERGGARISARSISDGTLRFLGTLLALRTASPGEVFLIEEIEEGLHPTRIHHLMSLLESVVREREIQVIATTHSPVVLQWLSPEALRDVIVFGRSPEHPGTLMQRLGELPHVDEVVERKGIEELFSIGWLEMAL